MISRWQQFEVAESLRYRRVVHITGARQTGKTTVARIMADVFKSVGLETVRVPFGDDHLVEHRQRTAEDI